MKKRERTGGPNSWESVKKKSACRLLGLFKPRGVFSHKSAVFAGVVLRADILLVEGYSGPEEERLPKISLQRAQLSAKRLRADGEESTGVSF